MKIATNKRRRWPAIGGVGLPQEQLPSLLQDYTTVDFGSIIYSIARYKQSTRDTTPHPPVYIAITHDTYLPEDPNLMKMSLTLDHTLLAQEDCGYPREDQKPEPPTREDK
ncbi:hypothetical protein J6590_008729 [Homalodisca vitripennis]|nr:hypothetical protein J6590_008729 [Homalodisca vitripennis]